MNNTNRCARTQHTYSSLSRFIFFAYCLFGLFGPHADVVSVFCCVWVQKIRTNVLQRCLKQSHLFDKAYALCTVKMILAQKWRKANFNDGSRLNKVKIRKLLMLLLPICFNTRNVYYSPPTPTSPQKKKKKNTLWRSKQNSFSRTVVSR